MGIPKTSKIYHIVHIDRLQSIIDDGFLWSDSVIECRPNQGSTIGLTTIKERRLKTALPTYPKLTVGQCVPFYFCPRSVMLYLIHKGNAPELSYKGGQEQIIHLEADLCKTVEWANQNSKRWVFTLSNAGSYYFEDRSSLNFLGDINWTAVQSNQWSGSNVSGDLKEGKQAEFLLEYSFPWSLFERIGVESKSVYNQVATIMSSASHKPQLEVIAEWYY